MPIFDLCEMPVLTQYHNCHYQFGGIRACAPNEIGKVYKMVGC